MKDCIDRNPDEFRGPSRKPWLIVFILVAVVTVAITYTMVWMEKRDSTTPSKTQSVAEAVPQPAAASSNEPPVPAAATASAATPAAAANAAHVGPVTVEMTAVIALETQGRLIEAQQGYYQLLADAAHASQVPEIEKRLGSVNAQLVFSAAAIPDMSKYTIQKGDSVDRIARRMKTTTELILKCNNISNPGRINVGQSINVFTGRFSIVVGKARNDLLLKVNDRFFKRYPTCTGKLNKTPAGTWVIDTREVNPTWWFNGRKIPFSGDPKGENILGTRWMSLKPTGGTPNVSGIGIHGTWDDASIGKSESAGCVRMHNPDVEELVMLVPLGTPVLIEE